MTAGGNSAGDDEAFPPRAPVTRPVTRQVRRVQLSDIMQGQRDVVIEHEGQDYRLRITASGKLILTK